MSGPVDVLAVMAAIVMVERFSEDDVRAARAARAAVAELIEADKEYDKALDDYNKCAPARMWHSPEAAAELIGYRSQARARLNAAKARRSTALANVGCAS